MKLKPILFAFFTICACLMTSRLSAQSAQSFIPLAFPKSPNAAEFAKYGDYTVNLYSGLPEISIPLYTATSGSLSVPISLSYHASGLTVDQAPGWIGAGWSLNTGGMITRRVVGRRDETGYFGAWRDATTLSPGSNNADIDYLRSLMSNGGGDTRPDIYSYDVPGSSGKFFYNHRRNNAITKIPFSPVKITGYPTIGYTMVDTHGTVYTLGKTYQELTGTGDDYGSHDLGGNTAWMLEKMISQSRTDTISFTYQQQSISNPPQTGQSIVVEDYQQNIGMGSPTNPCTGNYLSNSTNPRMGNTYATVNEQDPATIFFKNGKVEFKLSTNYRTDLNNYSGQMIHTLDTIKVSIYNFSTKKFEVQKSVVFYKSYYTTVTGVVGRLRLDSIQIRDKAGSTVQHYRFDYNNQPTPAYDSFSKDYWGYYNGKMDNPAITNRTLIPKTAVSYQISPFATPTTIYIGSDDPTSRDPDSTKMQAGVLKTIHFPTGGYTTFAYQTNRYYDGGGVMHLTGGLRVDSISSYDGTSSTPKVKTYKYDVGVPNFMTTGLSQQINYGFFVGTVTAVSYVSNFGPAQGCQSKQVRTYCSESASSLTPTEGNPVAYTSVTEYLGTPVNNVGKSVYSYRYTSDTWDGSATFTGIPVIYDYFYARGQLSEKIDYLRRSDGSYQKVKKDSNVYTAFPEAHYDTVGMVVGQRKMTEGDITVAYPDQNLPSDGNRFPFSDYSIRSDDNYLVSNKTKIYDPADETKYTTSTIIYTYDDTTHQQVVKTTHVDSKGNTHVSVNKFAYNYLSGGSTGNAVLDTMINRHMWGDAIERWDSVRNVATSVNSVAAAQLHQYQFGSGTGTIVPYKISILRVINPITNFTPSSIVSGNLTGDSRYVQMISYDQYDTKNNITQYTPRNATPTTIFWGYQYQYPIAQVKNATYSSSNPQCAYTSFEWPRNGSWFYTGTPVIDPTAPTGSMVYPLSSGAVTLTGITGTKNYILSLWSNNGAPTVSNGGTLTGSPMGSTSGWTYYEYAVPSTTTSLTISGSTSIDELRLYPQDAQMTTYAYSPSGVTDISDARGSVSSFEYDYGQRLKNIKDLYGNIINNYGYHTYDQTIGNDAMSGTFTRNNCPAGTSPTSTTFAVAANKYLSSTKASANAEASFDYNTNGQAKANQICGCPVTTTSFTLTNNTGLSGFQVTFSGVAPFNFPSSGSTVVQVPIGTYTTISVNANGTINHTFKLGVRANIVGHGASWSNITIATSGTTDTSITISN